MTICHASYNNPFFFFNDTATTEIYTLSLHDALPICYAPPASAAPASPPARRHGAGVAGDRDRKSTRLNSSHQIISYAVFCLKKKKAETLFEEPQRTQSPACHIPLSREPPPLPANHLS